MTFYLLQVILADVLALAAWHQVKEIKQTNQSQCLQFCFDDSACASWSFFPHEIISKTTSTVIPANTCFLESELFSQLKSTSPALFGPLEEVAITGRKNMSKVSSISAGGDVNNLIKFSSAFRERLHLHNINLGVAVENSSTSTERSRDIYDSSNLSATL
jgi:hypothetical protein